MKSIGNRRWRVVVIMLAGNGAFVVADAIGKGWGRCDRAGRVDNRRSGRLLR